MIDFFCPRNKEARNINRLSTKIPTKCEPGCAIKTAIENGHLDGRRLKSYLKLSKEMNYEGMSSKQIEEAKIKSMGGGFGEMKKVRDYGKQITEGNKLQLLSKKRKTF